MTIYSRIYNTKGSLSPQEIEKLYTQLQPLIELQKILDALSVPQKIVILTNEGLDPIAMKLLENSGLAVLKTRVHNMEIIGKDEGYSRGGGISNADMLNTIPSNEGKYFLLSSDFANTPEAVAGVIQSIMSLHDSFFQNVASLGVVTPVNHSHVLIEDILSGKHHITLENISQVFPNNAFSFYPGRAEFSQVTDNGFAGNIEVDGKDEPIGGNEDFYFGFSEMLQGKDVYMLIDPCVPGENRIGEVLSVGSKYARRKGVYQFYARRLIDEKCGGNNLVEEDKNVVFEKIIDTHFFFLRFQNGRPEILLTQRQKEKKII